MQPVRSQDVALLLHTGLRSEAVAEPLHGSGPRFGGLVDLLWNFTHAEELCTHLNDLPSLISTAVGEGSDLTAINFWYQVGGSLLLGAARRRTSCQDELIESLVALVTLAPNALDDPVGFSDSIHFTQFARDHVADLRRLIMTDEGMWAFLPRFVPFVFNSVSLRQRAAADLIYRFQNSRGSRVQPGERLEWCNSLGDLFVQRPETDFFELDLDVVLNEESRSHYASVGECVGMSLLGHSAIDRALPRWFFNKLINNRVTMSDLELDDPVMHRTLRHVERGGRRAVRVALRLDIDDPVPDVADYIATQLASLTPPEAEERFQAIRQGLSRLAPIHQLKTVLSAGDLRTLAVGDPGVSVDDLIDHFIIDHELLNSPIIEWLWDWVRVSPVETRRKFLNFVTGRTRLPLDGMAALPRDIRISFSADDTVRADQREFLLEIPRFSSRVQLALLLHFAVTRDTIQG